MARPLYIHRLKPNPRGKDHPGFSGPSAVQLAAEWVDIKNIGGTAINTQGIEIYHKVFGPGHQITGDWQRLMTLPDFNLPGGNVIRIHSGSRIDLSQLRPEDQAGAEWHCFTGTNRYVWNNKEGDSAALRDVQPQQFIDSATYDPYPPDGVILLRVGNKLVPQGTVSYLPLRS